MAFVYDNTIHGAIDHDSGVIISLGGYDWRVSHLYSYRYREGDLDFDFGAILFFKVVKIKNLRGEITTEERVTEIHIDVPTVYERIAFSLRKLGRPSRSVDYPHILDNIKDGLPVFLTKGPMDEALEDVPEPKVYLINTAHDREPVFARLKAGLKPPEH